MQEYKKVIVEEDVQYPATYECEVRIEKHKENNYGADRDRNRGIARTFIDEIIIEEVEVVNWEGESVDYLTEDEVPDWLYRAVEEELF